MPPDDNDLLAGRIQALAEWRPSFLYGIGQNKAMPNQTDQGEIQEIVRDLAEIAQAELVPYADEDQGQAEESYMELIEFVRVSVMLLWNASLARLWEPD